MAGRLALVTQAEVTRSIAAAIAAGLRIGRIEVDHRTGKVVIFPDVQGGELGGNPCDRLLK